MIFLGAGASKPYGIPTLEELSEEFYSKLRKIGHEQVIKNILESLEEFDMNKDFESFYSILEGLINPVSSVQHAGPLTAFLVKSKGNLPKPYDYFQVLSDLRKLLYEKCSIISNKQNFKKVKECMDTLLLATKQNRCVESLIGKVGPQDVNIGNTFVTTNYDMALELYFWSEGIPIIDGYGDNAGPVKDFDPSLLWKIYSSRKHKAVIKLHGSIWQFLRGNKMIKTIQDPKSSALPFEIPVEREMMIYPTREKDILSYQFFPFFSLFKSITWTKLLVIGYSFRDEPINTAIIENMKLDNKSQIIIISPNPREVLENLYNNIPEDINWRIPENRIYKYDGEFGSPEVFDYLESIEDK